MTATMQLVRPPVDEGSQASADVSPNATARVIVVFRVVLAGLFLTLSWKWSFFVAANRVYQLLPISTEFFPLPLQLDWTLRLAYLTALAAITIGLLTPERGKRIVCAGVLLATSSVMCLHQGSYNDMTFVTAWWTSLWLLWFSWQLEEFDSAALLRRAALLSRLIISLMLLGGAVGKWTGEYWSGEVFFEIYFRDRDFWLFNVLRDWFDEPSLRQLAVWYSRKVIVVETLCGCGLWLLPARWAAVLAIIVLTSIALLSNLMLFSVLSCLIGLAMVGLFVPAAERR